MDVIYVKDYVFLENISFEERTSDLIAKNTCNTWQKKRDLLEKIKDTKQGKLAEKFVKQYIEQHTGLSYLEYDEIRIDNYEKHAPFDGLLYLKDKLNKDILDECIKKINKCCFLVCQNPFVYIHVNIFWTPYLIPLIYFSILMQNIVL